MSWQGYVDSVVQHGAGVIKQATLIGLNGAIWTPAGPENVLNISQGEASAIATVMSAKSAQKVKDTFPASGVTVGGTRYMFLRDLDDDGRVVTAKKVGVGSLTIQSTVQAVIIAFTPDDQSSSLGAANKAVDSVAKYLEGTGY